MTEIKKLTQEEKDEAARLARKKWPESFEGENDGRPHITAKDSEALNKSLREMQVARTSGLPRCLRPKF